MLFQNIPDGTRTHTLFQDHNLGCRVGVSTALSWFFSEVERGIIVEDDCLPDPSFFDFCEKCLEAFKDDSRIKIISGQNPFGKFTTTTDVVFSKYPFIWGWASWRRAWNEYDIGINEWPCEEIKTDFKTWLGSKHAAWYWFQNFDDIKKGFDTWDFQLNYMMYKQKGLAAISATNLVRNLGFDSDATHTLNPKDVRQYQPVIPAPTQLRLPSDAAPNRRFDKKLVRLDYYNEDLTIFGTAKNLLRPLLRRLRPQK